MRSTGICIGASSLSLVVVERDPMDDSIPPQIVSHETHSHGGHPLNWINDLLSIGHSERIAVTGRKSVNEIPFPIIPETFAVEWAYRSIQSRYPGPIPAIVSAGAETILAYLLDGQGHIDGVSSGNKCASGTGEFLLQQLRRMGLELDCLEEINPSVIPHKVSGRCAVFCKSDCTHALNSGIAKPEIVSGLCLMVARKIAELLKAIQLQNTMLIGGMSRNSLVVHHLKTIIPSLIVPPEAPWFEALGAALWADQHPQAACEHRQLLVGNSTSSYQMVDRLSSHAHLVGFQTPKIAELNAGEDYVLGLDVGSTTTKAVLIRESDCAVAASIYLRTEGDPVAAARHCYTELLTQIRATVGLTPLNIRASGICGSGRQIAGLHAMTAGIVNEILAHATAAIHHDPEVDTLFEIGGQDAKYTFIHQGVPCDYAMNEACSAGTGSFLEESAFEALGIPMTEIASMALSAAAAPSFNDQCAAFIASDIKNAIQEGRSHEEIVAGLVHSICLNYINRVKGPRSVGKKILMQGGVCYNRAVPLAMAGILDKPIVVPPEPGLMGALGAALLMRKRLHLGLVEPVRIDLEVLANRTLEYGASFQCSGNRQGCDRGCEIRRIRIEGETRYFGGACPKFDKVPADQTAARNGYNMIAERQQDVFETFAQLASSSELVGSKVVVAINHSMLMNTYLPFFSTFFFEMGWQVVVPDAPDQNGMERTRAPFCHPITLAHGFLDSLLKAERRPDYVFLPHIVSTPASKGYDNAILCPLAQAEPFVLKAAFKEALSELERSGAQTLSPTLDMKNGLRSVADVLITMAKKAGIESKVAQTAFEKALVAQESWHQNQLNKGRLLLEQLKSDPDLIAMVVFGRAYSAFCSHANMDLPLRMASLGMVVIPYDCLPEEGSLVLENNYWTTGQSTLGTAQFVQKHPQLFPVWITHFSCGPDSFLIPQFRDIMGAKPSLTLELDSHTADAGLMTRIEAFREIVVAWRQIQFMQTPSNEEQALATVTWRKGKSCVRLSSGAVLPMSHPSVTLLLPSMGNATEAFAAALRFANINAIACGEPDADCLRTGRAHSYCKECLPLALTVGSLMEYVKNQKRPDETVVYFMPSAAGPCRFGQYSNFLETLIRKEQLRDVALLSLTSENGYAGFSHATQLRLWYALVIADIMEDVKALFLANASVPTEARTVFDRVWQGLLNALETASFRKLKSEISNAAEILATLPMKRPPHEVPRVLLTGEIFVRREPFSRQNLAERLAEKGFATLCSPCSEWLHYTHHLVIKKQTMPVVSWMGRTSTRIVSRYLTRVEKAVRSQFSRHGLAAPHLPDIERLTDLGKPHISPELIGEAILTVGAAISAMEESICGVIAIAPFGCMPNRIAESILNTDALTMPDEQVCADECASEQPLNKGEVERRRFPLLAIESDGLPLSQLAEARFESFVLNAQRLDFAKRQANRKKHVREL